jgi:hypothetical protein
MKESGPDHLSETESNKEEVVPVKPERGDSDQKPDDTSHQNGHEESHWKRDIEMEIGNGSRIGSNGDKPSLPKGEKTCQSGHQVGPENQDGMETGDLKDFYIKFHVHPHPHPPPSKGEGIIGGISNIFGYALMMYLFPAMPSGRMSSSTKIPE